MLTLWFLLVIGESLSPASTIMCMLGEILNLQEVSSESLYPVVKGQRVGLPIGEKQRESES